MCYEGRYCHPNIARIGEFVFVLSSQIKILLIAYKLTINSIKNNTNRRWIAGVECNNEIMYWEQGGRLVITLARSEMAVAEMCRCRCKSKINGNR